MCCNGYWVTHCIYTWAYYLASLSLLFLLYNSLDEWALPRRTRGSHPWPLCQVCLTVLAGPTLAYSLYHLWTLAGASHQVLALSLNISSPFSASFFLKVPSLSPLCFPGNDQTAWSVPCVQPIQPHLSASVPSPSHHPNTIHSRYTCSSKVSLYHHHAFIDFSVLEMASTFSSNSPACSIQTSLGSFTNSTRTARGRSLPSLGLHFPNYLQFYFCNYSDMHFSLTRLRSQGLELLYLSVFLLLEEWHGQ